MSRCSWMEVHSEGDSRPAIIASLLFTGEKYGRAEEVVQFYLWVFRNSKPGMFVHYPAGMEPDQEGYVHPAVGYRGFVEGIAVTVASFREKDYSAEVEKMHRTS